ncbi:MAG: LamG domain-containing protein [Candidatus Eisenbacteria bacterium]
MRRLVASVLALMLGACARSGIHPANAPGIAPQAPAADSITSALWRMDEAGTTRVVDAGPFRLSGTAGVDTRTDFGRYRSSRLFTRNPNSFVHVPYNPALESTRGLTVEAWVNVTEYGLFELAPLVSRWSPVPNEQSWLLGMVGRKLNIATAGYNSPGIFSSLVTGMPPGRLVFMFQPEQAAAAVAWPSISTIPANRWVHVAATLDGEVVKLYVDGRLDAQYATVGQVRRSTAPLMIGNVFDERRLTDFGGDLRWDPSQDQKPYYAFVGSIDEVRISSLARTAFDSARPR